MKSNLRRLTPALAILMLASVSALAKHGRTVKLSEPASLGSTQIAAGEYEVTWVSHSPLADVTFTKGKEVVATAEGKWVDRDTKYNTDSLVYSRNPDGSRTIVEIRFAGMQQALVFGQSS